MTWHICTKDSARSPLRCDAPSSLDDRILATLADADQPVPFAELRSQCRVRAITLHERIGVLCVAGHIFKIDGGYRLADR